MRRREHSQYTVITCLFSPETEDTDGCFVGMMESGNTKHNIQKSAGNTVHSLLRIGLPF